ncbi:hypothetical protein [Streptomyces sp. NPDC054794]
MELLYRPEDPERIILIAYNRHMNIWFHRPSLLLGAMALLWTLSATASLPRLGSLFWITASRLVDRYIWHGCGTAASSSRSNFGGRWTFAEDTSALSRS